ncbi:MAG: hypothetical protein KF780_10175 [Sphingomonas sp.]|nr:hypothetical protein [Sphingomonas sp.]
MRFRSTPALAAMAFALLLGGCVSQGPFPSLAPRPGEGDFTLAEPDRPAPVTADDPALRRQVETLRAGAQDGRRAFDDVYDEGHAAIGRSGVEGSDAWVEAQQALSRLEAARATTADALTQLHGLATERADLPTSRADFALIQSAIAEVEDIDQAQQARIAPLRERLTPR